MSDPGAVLLVFAVVQGAFIAADALTLSRETRAGARPELRGLGVVALGFLAGVWLVYFVIQTALVALTPSVEATVAALAAAFGVTAAPAGAGPAALALLLAVTFLAVGFWDYLLHRFLLHGRGGWLLHENHHLPTVVANGIPGISVRPFVAVTTFLTSLGTAATMLGVMIATGTTGVLADYFRSLPALVVVLTCVGSASHSAFLRTQPWVHRLLGPLFVTTPQEHVLHHATGLRGNYGNFTSFWDRVFGTYLRPAEGGAPVPRLGLPYDQDFLGTLTAGRWKLPPSVRERCRLDAFCHLNPRFDGASEEPER